MRDLIQKAASGLVFWLGIGCIVTLAVPAAIFLGLIALIWTGVNELDRLIQQGKI